ncbi:hypothetical protein H5410_015197 [Solanum commersonii]|uniref:Uncharacterized protein n=1 Tax=Solanum commersonii TaxID=4109 RepID=A0A9J5ZSW8_SOLCO|nr:hypothetical protein H5410_015197 [Solanum commersonii]
MVFVHRPIDIGRRLPASVVACAHRSTDVECGLLASSVAYTQRSIDVGWPASIVRGLHTSVRRRRT